MKSLANKNPFHYPSITPCTYVSCKVRSGNSLPIYYFFFNLTGASYTPPEYYINMRTGTHYFPKGVNTLAIEATRYKFGLNKIEEMSPQDPLVSVKTQNFIHFWEFIMNLIFSAEQS